MGMGTTKKYEKYYISIVFINWWITKWFVNTPYGHQYGDCSSYESDSQSAKCKSPRLAPRVTNKRSTRKTSLDTVTVLNERTNL